MQKNRSGKVSSQPRLYSLASVAIAACLGGWLAGGILAGQNYFSRGRNKEGYVAVLSGVSCNLAVLIFLLKLPEELFFSIPLWAVSLAAVLTVLPLVWALQGQSIRSHTKTRGAFHPKLKALAIGFWCMMLIVFSVAVFALMIL